MCKCLPLCPHSLFRRALRYPARYPLKCIRHLSHGPNRHAVLQQGFSPGWPQQNYCQGGGLRPKLPEGDGPASPHRPDEASEAVRRLSNAADRALVIPINILLVSTLVPQFCTIPWSTLADRYVVKLKKRARPFTLALLRHCHLLTLPLHNIAQHSVKMQPFHPGPATRTGDTRT